MIPELEKDGNIISGNDGLSLTAGGIEAGARIMRKLISEAVHLERLAAGRVKRRRSQIRRFHFTRALALSLAKPRSSRWSTR